MIHTGYRLEARYKLEVRGTELSIKLPSTRLPVKEFLEKDGIKEHGNGRCEDSLNKRMERLKGGRY